MQGMRSFRARTISDNLRGALEVQIPGPGAGDFELKFLGGGKGI